ncbi:unnamed protein product [Linum tenue]|uniref:Uncharacterized protein n=2 Tax=Linum tenue TaxID=586396 RepID=A0AAV0MR20_9ROSI|nr:unnamed protein product [Linum tenue]
MNYLRPDLKRECFSVEEERMILHLHRMLGNRWAQITIHLPSRTDNEIKNFWNSSVNLLLAPQAGHINYSYLSNHSFPATTSASSSL